MCAFVVNAAPAAATGGRRPALSCVFASPSISHTWNSAASCPVSGSFPARGLGSPVRSTVRLLVPARLRGHDTACVSLHQGGHLSCSHIWTVGNNAAVGVSRHVSVWPRAVCTGASNGVRDQSTPVTLTLLLKPRVRLRVCPWGVCGASRALWPSPLPMTCHSHTVTEPVGLHTCTCRWMARREVEGSVLMRPRRLALHPGRPRDRERTRMSLCSREAP